MKHASRILIATFLVSFPFGATPTASATTVVGGTSENNGDVDWAVAQFADAGLELPPVVVEFHADDAGCDGYDGVFRGGQDPFRLDICTANRYIILHEFAHAWDRHNLTDELRHEFMELRDLTVWNGSGTWKQRGVEALAEVITWGMRDHLFAAGADEKLQAYQLVTGQVPKRSKAAADISVDRNDARDPLDAEAGWDDIG
jgi:hypothetical protein